MIYIQDYIITYIKELGWTAFLNITDINRYSIKKL